MFEEENVEMAANVEQTGVDKTPEVQPTSPVENVDQTKAFATRLKEEKAKAKLEAKEEIAKSFGFSNWQEYADSMTNKSLLEKGLDPEEVRPVIKDLLKNDPEYIEAMKYKAEKEELEKEIFASNSIQDLNAKFGTSFKSVNELDEETIKMWNNGVPLDKAYAANNWNKIVESAVKKVSMDNGKSHLKTVTGSSEQKSGKQISTDEIQVAKMFGFSEEQFRNYIKSHEK